MKQAKFEKELAERNADPIAWAAKRNKPAEFKEPPMLGLITRLFRGIKFDVKHIHIRYEDDYFSRGRPFSFGFTIERISLDNHTAEEERQRNEE